MYVQVNVKSATTVKNSNPADRIISITFTLEAEKNNKYNCLVNLHVTVKHSTNLKARCGILDAVSSAVALIEF